MDMFTDLMDHLRYAATVTENSGQYICPPAAVEEGSELARNQELSEQLMKLTHQLIKDKTGGDLEFH